MCLSGILALRQFFLGRPVTGPRPSNMKPAWFRPEKKQQHTIRAVVDIRSVRRVTEQYNTTNQSSHVNSVAASGASTVNQCYETYYSLRGVIGLLDNNPHAKISWHLITGVFPTIGRCLEDSNHITCALTRDQLDVLSHHTEFTAAYTQLFRSYCLHWYQDALTHLRDEPTPTKLNIKRLRCLYHPVLVSAKSFQRADLLQCAAHCVVAIITKHNQTDSNEPDRIDDKISEFLHTT